MKDAGPFAHLSPSAALPRHIFFSPNEISWLTSKAALHPEEITLVGSGGGRRRVEKKKWDLWTERVGGQTEDGLLSE